MPRIKLKPNSPEFDDSTQDYKTQGCEMPGCLDQGAYKAPKHRGLNEYYNFCLEHVREYNKAWNFFEGMANEEVQEHMCKSMYGDRPTWRYDTEGAAEDILKRKAWQTYHFSQGDPRNYNHGKKFDSGGIPTNSHSPEYEALAIMGLEPPVTLESIKSRYKELAKKHHPDLNRGCNKSEELLKQINMAYTILKLAYEQFEELPSS